MAKVTSRDLDQMTPVASLETAQLCKEQGHGLREAWMWTFPQLHGCASLGKALHL